MELPKKLWKLDDGAFQLCHNLETVVMPEDISAVSSNVFYDVPMVNIVMGTNTYNYET